MKSIKVIVILACVVAIILLIFAFILENKLLSFIGSGVALLCALANLLLTYGAKKKNDANPSVDTK